jgi:hypothetical protein
MIINIITLLKLYSPIVIMTTLLVRAAEPSLGKIPY